MPIDVSFVGLAHLLPTYGTATGTNAPRARRAGRVDAVGQIDAECGAPVGLVISQNDRFSMNTCHRNILLPVRRMHHEPNEEFPSLPWNSLNSRLLK